MAEPERTSHAASSPSLQGRAAGAFPKQGRTAGPLAGFLARVRPQVEELLVRYRIPASAAEEILQATLQVLVWKWESVRNREAWLMAVMERKCRLVVAAGEAKSGE